MHRMVSVFSRFFWGGAPTETEPTRFSQMFIVDDERRSKLNVGSYMVKRLLGSPSRRGKYDYSGSFSEFTIGLKLAGRNLEGHFKQRVLDMLLAFRFACMIVREVAFQPNRTIYKAFLFENLASVFYKPLRPHSTCLFVRGYSITDCILS